jgi:hypothetical protein
LLLDVVARGHVADDAGRLRPEVDPLCRLTPEQVVGKAQEPVEQARRRRHRQTLGQRRRQLVDHPVEQRARGQDLALGA